MSAGHNPDNVVDIPELRSLRKKFSEGLADDDNHTTQQVCNSHRNEIIRAVVSHSARERLMKALNNGQGGTVLTIIDEILTGKSL